MSQDLNELRKVAEATPAGDWNPRTTGPRHGDHWYVASGGEHVAMIAAQDGINEEEREPLATHIAMFDPPTVLALLSRLEQAEQKVASLKSKMDGENLRWVAWEMVENSGQLDLPVVTWINRISDDEVSIEAAKYFFFGGISPCIHLGGDEPFDIDDEDRPECEHCNRRAREINKEEK